MTPAKKETFRETWKSCWEKFEANRTQRNTRKAASWAPKNSMAWTDMKKGRIITNEKLQQVALPSTVCRMLADDARNRTNCEPTPLMSLNVLPPSLFFQSHLEMKRAQPLNEKQVLDVLARVKTILRKISQALNVSLFASVERRNADNSTCLFTYFDGFPWALVGGMIVIDEKDTTKPPPPHAIYEVWRNQFFNSLHALIPPPIFSKMKRCIDYGSDMEWCINVAESEDIREVLQKIQSAKINPIYSILWTTKPMDHNPRNQEFSSARSLLIRQVEAEVKSFWTYEKIGVYLKMYYNSDT